MANNNIYVNAAITAFIEAVIEDRQPSDTVALDYADMVLAAAAFSVSIDALIANDPAISDVGGEYLPPTTAVIQALQDGRSQLLKSCCRAILAGRSYDSQVSADYDGLAAVIVAMWTQGVTALWAT